MLFLQFYAKCGKITIIFMKIEEQQIKQLFGQFLTHYDVEAKDAIWEMQSKQFRDFWSGEIMGDNGRELNESETDQIIRILDRNGKGNTKDSEAVARAMIAQGAWRRMFNGIKVHKEFSRLLNEIFLENDLEKKSKLINNLYKINENRQINNLTGQSGNAINAMLAAFDPFHNLSAISLKDRQGLYEFFGIEGEIDFESDDIGRKVVFSNDGIIKFFENLGIRYSARTISAFFYSQELKPLWKEEKHEVEVIEQAETVRTELTGGTEVADPSLFYMESQLEDFLIENWDKTELGEKYELIEEDDHFSQQYPTGIGRIDILVKDRETKQYVVIELKKGQTSDDTVGQLARYMGWLEEHKTNGKPTKGIIIAAQYDQRLYYALKQLKNVEVYLYKVDFKLEEFKK